MQNAKKSKIQKVEIENYKLLIIEKNRDLLQVYQSKFVKSGFRVLNAESGREGLVLAQREKPNLILLEIDMEDVSSLEIVKLLKNDLRTKNIPILILGCLEFELRITKCLKLGATTYVDILEETPKEIERKIKKLLEIDYD